MYHEKNSSGLATYLSFFYLRMRASPALQMHHFTFGDVIDVGDHRLQFRHRIDADAAPNRARVAEGPSPGPVDPFELHERRDERCLYVESLNRWITRSRPASNEALVRSSPEGIVTRHLPVLPDRYSPRLSYDMARKAETFHDLASPDYEPVVEEYSFDYTNRRGARPQRRQAVFFASFVSIIDSHLLKLWKHLGRDVQSFLDRVVRDRRICYTANARSIRICVSPSAPGAGATIRARKSSTSSSAIRRKTGSFS